MACLVMKFGGSSVADTEKLRQVARMIKAVKSKGYDVAVVVSAMGKTTDNLVAMARKIAVRPARREMDMLLSTGERITMALLSIALQDCGLAAVSLTGSQAGIITSDRHNDAQVIEVRPFRVQDEMARGRVVIVGGFQGVSYKRDITTLGRGGSDTTAVALAAALDAERCEIYSDVDGVYSADPAMVAEARHLPQISYPVMQEMSTAGAKVLNAHAVQFAKEKQIAIYARSTFAPGRQTVVRRFAPGALLGVKAVVSQRGVALVRFDGRQALESFKQAAALLEKEQVPIREVNILAACRQPPAAKASFVVATGDVYGWEKIRSGLRQRFGQKISIDHDLGAVSLIGEGLNRNNTTLLKTLALLARHEIAVEGVTTTSFRISMLIGQDDLEQAVKLCHGRWIG